MAFALAALCRAGTANQEESRCNEHNPYQQTDYGQ